MNRYLHQIMGCCLSSYYYYYFLPSYYYYFYHYYYHYLLSYYFYYFLLYSIPYVSYIRNRNLWVLHKLVERVIIGWAWVIPIRWLLGKGFRRMMVEHCRLHILSYLIWSYNIYVGIGSMSFL